MLYDNAQFISVFSISDFLNKDTKNLFLVQQTVDYWMEQSLHFTESTISKFWEKRTKSFKTFQRAKTF